MDTVLAGLVDETTLTEVVGVNEATVEVAVVVPEAEIETDTEVCVLPDAETVVEVGRVVEIEVDVETAELVDVCDVVVAAAAEVTATAMGAKGTTVVSVELCPDPSSTTFSHIAFPPPVARHPTCSNTESDGIARFSATRLASSASVTKRARYISLRLTLLSLHDDL